jgi:hypothetical protein
MPWCLEKHILHAPERFQLSNNPLKTPKSRTITAKNTQNSLKNYFQQQTYKATGFLIRLPANLEKRNIIMSG